MTFFLSEDITKDDFEGCLSLQFAAFDKPPVPVRPILFPILTEGPDARAIAIRESAERVSQEEMAASNRHWAKIVEAESGRIVATCSLQVYHEDPFTGRPEIEATWWPDGERRRFATRWVRTLKAPHRKYMSKPHVCKSKDLEGVNVQLTVMTMVDVASTFVHPDCRGKGLAKQILEWAVRMIDDLQMEAYLGATTMARPLYEQFGFIAGPAGRIDFRNERAGDEWHAMEKEYLPFDFWPMWRPAKGSAVVSPFSSDKAFPNQAEWAKADAFI